MINASQRLILKCFAASVATLALAACGNSVTQTTPTFLQASDLSGAYVFSLTGTDPTDGDYAVAGTFTADGKGTITSGIADYNLGSGVDTSVPLTGTYAVTSGTATITLTDGGSVKETYLTNLVKTGTTTIFRTDGTGTGTLYSPVTSTAPAGTYSVAITGEGNNTVTGTANFTAGTTGSFSGGTERYSDGNTGFNYASISGFLYPKQSNGRGQAAIGGNTFSYYMASANQLVLVGLDDRVLLSGTATKQ